MPKLTETQLVILSAAAQRDGGAILPLPPSLSLNKGVTASVLKVLIRQGLIEERPAFVGAEVWRENDNGERTALAITGAGLQAIGVERDDKADITDTENHSQATKPCKPASKPSTEADVRPGTKQALLIDLLKRKIGATIDEVVEATGWQAHSVRGAISSTLKKKLSLDVISEKVDGRGRIYRIAGQR